jgi:replicative DNA helicase Mcm
MPPSLLSRFDLIFVLQDVPNDARDRGIARHILNSHYAGELSEHKKNIDTEPVSADQIAMASENIQPVVDAILMRKYVAYSRRNCFPIMDDGVRERLEEQYMEMRKPKAEDSPIAVTARQLEALVRLCEASARLRLSNRVTADDVDVTIRIVMASLKQSGTDPETGQLDADVIGTGTPKSQRERIASLRDIIVKLQEGYANGVPEDVLIAEAEKIHISKDKVEKEIKKLKEIGEILEPRHGKYHTT